MTQGWRGPGGWTLVPAAPPRGMRTVVLPLNPSCSPQAMGSPTTLSSAQLAALMAASQLRTQPMAGADGVVAVEHGKGATPEAVTVNLPRQGVAMLVWPLTPRGQPTAAVGM